MFNTIFIFLTGNVTTLWGILLYWLPLSICIFGFTVRTHRNIQKDLESSKSDKYYFPKETVGTIIGRVLISILPIANLWAAMFDLSPHIFKEFFDWIGRVFDMPIVPKKR